MCVVFSESCECDSLLYIACILFHIVVMAMWFHSAVVIAIKLKVGIKCNACVLALYSWANTIVIHWRRVHNISR